MKTAFLIVLLPLIARCSANIQTRLVELRVDHFNPLDTRTFDSRYLINSELWIPGGPIFIYVAGGSAVYDDLLTNGAVYEIARDTNAHIFSLEHRYFGESRPTPDTTVRNLQYLTIHQALADLSQFISFIKENYYGTSNSRVVLWGRGYGGALAVWARQKYPNLVNAVWSSSAPINAVLEYPQFMSNTFYTINSIGGPECGQIIEGAFRILEDAIRSRDTSYVQERLRLCSPVDIDISEDVSRLFFGIAADIGYTFVSNARYPDIDDKCITMRGLNTPNDLPENDFEAFARWYVDDYNSHLDCLNFNNTAVVSLYQNVEWDSVSTIAGRRQNFWLQCTQLGQFATSNEGLNHPFGWRFDISFFTFLCSQAFDQALFTQEFMEESVARTNEFFGGLHPQVYRVFFTHGEMDPKKSLGPSEDLNENSPVVVMSLQSFGRDFGSPSETDYAVLIQTKERARELIIKWIFDSIDEDLPTPPPVVPISQLDDSSAF